MFERVLPLQIRSSSTDSASPERVNEVELRVAQASSGAEAVVVWDAALVLAYYLEHRQRALQLDRGPAQVVELGSGTGAVGLVAAALGARSVLTDLPEFVPLLERNIELNRERLRGPIQARALPWGSEYLDRVPDLVERGADYILVSDCVYYEAAVRPLVETLVALSRERTRVLLAYEERASAEKVAVQNRFRDLIERHFRIEPVAPAECHPDYACPEIKLWLLRKRPVSASA